MLPGRNTLLSVEGLVFVIVAHFYCRVRYCMDVAGMLLLLSITVHITPGCHRYKDSKGGNNDGGPGKSNNVYDKNGSKV